MQARDGLSIVALAVCVGMELVNGQAAASTKVLVAHRGASAYTPEHTLSAYRLALAHGADFVEQDLAVTKDGVLVCLHDESLERTTNAEEVFPDRGSVDPSTGRRRWLAGDFTLAEIKSLDAGSWFDQRFAGERVPTWEEAAAVVGNEAGLYPELKTPALYRDRGVNPARLFAESLKAPALAGRRGGLIVQSFDEATLQELTRILPDVPRTFLIEAADGPRWLSAEGFSKIAAFATGIGPSKSLLDGRPEIVAMAHRAGLTVTPYTFTSRAPAPRFPDVREEMRYFLFTMGVDAVFTDNPDRFPRSDAR